MHEHKSLQSQQNVCGSLHITGVSNQAAKYKAKAKVKALGYKVKPNLKNNNFSFNPTVGY